MFLGETGKPILKMALENILLALAGTSPIDIGEANHQVIGYDRLAHMTLQALVTL